MQLGFSDRLLGGPEARAPRCVRGGIANLLIGAVVLGGPLARAPRCVRGSGVIGNGDRIVVGIPLLVHR